MAKSILGLTRWKTILTIAISLIATRIFIIDYFYTGLTMSPTVPISHYSIFVLETILFSIAASIFNEYANQAQYKQIRPEIQYIGNVISEKTSLILSYSFAGVFIATCYIIGAINGFLHLGSIAIAIVFAIYLYITKYKYTYFSGKLILSLLYALLFLLPIVFEVFCLMSKEDLFRAIGAQQIIPLFQIGLFFASFAFILTFLTEITKDLRDEEDDTILGSKTFVTNFGEKLTKGCAYFFTLLLIAAVAYFQIRYYQHSKSMIVVGMSLLVHLPLLYYMKELKSANAIQDHDFLVKLLNMVFISLLFATTTVQYIMTNAVV